ncbi:hypothetical protein [Thalassotalea eurytherma]|uniref:Alkaline phosphatase family protein n=1 Tax=Thalassotalea eurytherma TaxID=1144278 RepID=A0ABQ6H1N3_9GAMM|nr:hypothetical protein [Thalassotalea eurytherma]GLX82108.1 hypothetical protein theurythT_15600 [Thalassotalea eurytherma]
MKKLLTLEFNELCPDLVDRFIQQGQLPNFAKLKQQSELRETITDATGDDLNPWIQWVDVHTGKNRDEHGIYRLNEIKKYKGTFTWDELTKQGIKSWVCGSMNASYSEKFSGRFLPDPWTQDVAPFPSGEMNTFYNFVSQSVQGHSQAANVSSKAFLKSILKQGVSLSTFCKLTKQVISEKFKAELSWKRAMMLDWVQFDIFKHYFRKEQPQYCTFFSNAVAHYQHHYWRDFDPQAFGLTSADIDADKADAILLAYKNTDKLLGEFLNLVGDDTAIIFVTALSQEPYTESERFYYHINSEKAFYDTFDIPSDVKYRAVMAEQFHLHANSPEQAKEIEAHLNSFELDSNEYFHVGTNKLFLVSVKENVVHVQCRCTKEVKAEAEFSSGEQRYTFQQHFYKMNETKAGGHNPRGIYWFKKPGGKQQLLEDVPPAQVHEDTLAYFNQ